MIQLSSFTPFSFFAIDSITRKLTPYDTVSDFPGNDENDAFMERSRWHPICDKPFGDKSPRKKSF